MLEHRSMRCNCTQGEIPRGGTGCPKTTPLKSPALACGSRPSTGITKLGMALLPILGDQMLDGQALVVRKRPLSTPNGSAARASSL